MPLGLIEFIVFTMVFNANITTRVNGENLWDHHTKYKPLISLQGIRGFIIHFMLFKLIVGTVCPKYICFSPKVPPPTFAWGYMFIFRFQKMVFDNLWTKMV